MPALRVDVKARSAREVVPAEFAIEATFTNISSGPVFLNTHQASHPALVLQVLDEKNEPVLMSPPSAPDKEDLAPGERLEPGQSITLDYAGFLDRDLPTGLYRVRYFSPYPVFGWLQRRSDRERVADISSLARAGVSQAQAAGRSPEAAA